ncbi:TPA: hypothetical protein J2F72_004725 [Escherichia coli]|nr:hypothetical protein [Escherichia coli]
MKAATAFRRGFAENTYIAEILCGNLYPFPLALRHDYSSEPDTARQYYETFCPLWGKYPEALLFINWLYNQSGVLSERAEFMKCAEMLLRADDQEMNESIFQQRELLRERIDDRLSEEIVQKLRTLNGEEIWPWMLPTDPRRHLLSEQSEISVISATGCHSGLSKDLLPLTYVSSAI